MYPKIPQYLVIDVMDCFAFDSCTEKYFLTVIISIFALLPPLRDLGVFHYYLFCAVMLLNVLRDRGRTDSLFAVSVTKLTKTRVAVGKNIA
jgi:hypothetical protein